MEEIWKNEINLNKITYKKDKDGWRKQWKIIFSKKLYKNEKLEKSNKRNYNNIKLKK